MSSNITMRNIDALPARPLGKLLYSQQGGSRFSLHGYAALILGLLFGTWLLLAPLKIEAPGSPSSSEALFWNLVVRGFGVASLFIGISGIWLPRKELIEVYEEGLILRTSFVDLFKGILGRPPRFVPFTDISEVYLNENIEMPPAGFLRVGGRLDGVLAKKAASMVLRQGGSLPIFVLRLDLGRPLILPKSGIRDWRAFVSALTGSVRINGKEFHLAG